MSPPTSTGEFDWILDDGPCPLGLELTIVACVGGTVRLLRPGAIPREALEAALGEAIGAEPGIGTRAPTAPGQLASHYAPRARLRLDATDVREGEAALDFGGVLASGETAARLDLSASRDLAEAAMHLFAHLRALDATGAATIAVAPIPERDLGVAIVDRLRRAAAPGRDDTR